MFGHPGFNKFSSGYRIKQAGGHNRGMIALRRVKYQDSFTRLDDQVRQDTSGNTLPDKYKIDFAESFQIQSLYLGLIKTNLY